MGILRVLQQVTLPSFGMRCSNSQLTSAHPFLSLFLFIYLFCLFLFCFVFILFIFILFCFYFVYFYFVLFLFCLFLFCFVFILFIFILLLLFCLFLFISSIAKKCHQQYTGEIQLQFHKRMNNHTSDIRQKKKRTGMVRQFPKCGLNNVQPIILERVRSLDTFI